MPSCFWFGFSFPCAPPSSTGWSGDVGEDCLSAKREFRSRLTSRATQGTRVAGGKLGATSFGYFSWQDRNYVATAQKQLNHCIKLCAD